MNRHIDDTRLNDYLEGLATEEVARDVEAHLAACEECSERLEGLTVLLSGLAGLPDAATPGRDLWAGVQSEIEAATGQGSEDTGADEAIPLWRGRSVGSRRFSFSAAQLVAASVVWAFLSGGAVWMVFAGGPDRARVAVTDIPREAEVREEPGRILSVTRVATTEYEQAIASLESILEQGRHLLNSQTVATIEASLTAIDRAINEARQALADDPNNAALNRLLIKHEQSKLRVLRQASAAVQI
jgi:hypothetical protein